MVDALSEAQEVRKLISQCLSGDREAARQFQDSYGELIYGYPMRVYHTPQDDAGDFYVFAFDGGRIFRRLRTFEGRAPFRAYLLGFVLDDLVLEWKRGERSLDTVSIEDVGQIADMSQVNAGAGGDAAGDPMDMAQLNELLAGAEPSKAVVMKLLHIEDYELTAAEIGHVAGVSGRNTVEVLAAVECLRDSVREREVTLKAIENTLDEVQAWIQLYERRLYRVAEDLEPMPPTATAARRLLEERTELERKIERRRRQREKLLTRRGRRKVTAPYKDIAVLLNTSVGNVGSQIARLRQELLAQAGTRVHGVAAGSREPGAQAAETGEDT